MRAEPLLDRRAAELSLSGLSLPELLLSTGAMTGPFRRPKPATVTTWARIRRALRAWAVARRSPL